MSCIPFGAKLSSFLFLEFFGLALLACLTGISSAQTFCSPGASLSVTQTDPNDPFDLFSESPLYQLTYTATVTNVGTNCATNVELFDLLPSGSTLLSATPSQGACSQSFGTVSCNLGTLAPGAVATVVVKISPSFEDALITNTVNVFSDQTGLSNSVENTNVMIFSPISYDFCGNFESSSGAVENCSDDEATKKVSAGNPRTEPFSVGGLGNVGAFTVSTSAPFAIFEPSTGLYKPTVNFNGSENFSLTMRVTLDLNEPFTRLNSEDILYIRDLIFDFGNGVTYSRFVTAVGSAPSVGANQPPTANSQSVSTRTNTAKLISLSGSDPNGTTLLTFNIVNSPAHGTLSLSQPSGPRAVYDVLYVPFADFNGGDSFTFTVNDGAALSNTATVNITFVDSDHFKCYTVVQAKAPKGQPAFDKFIKQSGVTLVDGIETKSTNILKPLGFCNPVSVEDEGVLGSEAHLEGYQIKDSPGQEKFQKRSYTVSNSYFDDDLVITLSKIDRLLVLTGSSTAEPASAVIVPAAPFTDHFKCYAAAVAKTPRGAAVPYPAFSPGQQLQLQDEFDEASNNFLAEIIKPLRLCFPATLNGGTLKQPDNALMCYSIKAAPENTAPAFQTKRRYLKNIFGPEVLDSTRIESVCISSTVSPPPP
jgi:uncharacterized repeat protein (TIGR01451 family)